MVRLPLAAGRADQQWIGICWIQLSVPFFIPSVLGNRVPLVAAPLKKVKFQCFFEVRDDLGQGTGGGTKNRAATPKMT